jgi:hypothetical protein
MLSLGMIVEVVNGESIINDWICFDACEFIRLRPQLAKRPILLCYKTIYLHCGVDLYVLMYIQESCLYSFPYIAPSNVREGTVLQGCCMTPMCLNREVQIQTY